METDRDGLIDLRGTGVQIAVSPELILRGVVLCNAALKGATERGWTVKTAASPGAHLRLSINGEQLDFAVEEKTEPIPGLFAAPGARRQRRPTGNLQLTLGSGYQKASISDKRGTRIESKLAMFFEKGEALAAAITRRTRPDRQTATRVRDRVAPPVGDRVPNTPIEREYGRVGEGGAHQTVCNVPWLKRHPVKDQSSLPAISPSGLGGREIR